MVVDMHCERRKLMWEVGCMVSGVCGVHGGSQNGYWSWEFCSAEKRRGKKGWRDYANLGLMCEGEEIV